MVGTEGVEHLLEVLAGLKVLALQSSAPLVVHETHVAVPERKGINHRDHEIYFLREI